MAGGALCALLLTQLPQTVRAEVLTATIIGEEAVLAQVEVPRDGAWCILWRHSVQGFEVEDCYVNRDGDMVLMRSHLPDFAAGLDHIPGRGIQLSDGMGGYWIEDLNEPVPGNAYVLRPGSMKVDHRLQIEDTIISLSKRAAHKRVRIALTSGKN